MRIATDRLPDVADDAAVFERLVAARRSTRGFLPAPVPRALIERVLAVAGQAPSGCNAQPWVVHVASGATLARLGERLGEVAGAGRATAPDVPIVERYAGVYRERQVGAAVTLFDATGVARHDREARAMSMLRNYHFFDAPHAALVFLPAAFGLREAADCGMYAQTLMLALTAHGLASCAQASLSHHADVVHEVLGVGPELNLLFGLSFGYSDDAHPANTARTDRAALAETTTFHD